MNNTHSLVSMQMKDKLKLGGKQSVFSLIAKVVIPVVKFAAITAVIFVVFYFVSFLRLVSLSAGIPIKVMTFIFGLMFVLALLTSVVRIISHLFYARDNVFLLTLPVSRGEVYTSKLIVYIIYDYLRNVTFFGPVMVAFALVNSITWTFYLWLPVALLILTLLIVGISALVSIPTVYITKFVGSNKYVVTALMTLVISAIVVLLFAVISLIPEDINLIASWSSTYWDIQDFLDNFMTSAPALYGVTVAMVGENLGVVNLFFADMQIKSLLVVLGVTLVAMVVAFFAIRPVFFAIASSANEHRSKNHSKAGKNIRRNSIFTELHKEFLLMSRDGGKFNALLLIVVIMPMSILLINKIFGAMDVKSEGAGMIAAFNIMIMCLVALASNGYVAKMFSQDGRAIYVVKSSPAKPIRPLTTRLLLRAICLTVAILSSSIIVGITVGYDTPSIIKIFITVESVYIAHLLASALRDLMNPRNNIVATSGTQENNPNENAATLTAFFISAIFGVLTYFFRVENFNTVWDKILIFALVYLAYSAYMYVIKIKILYKDK